MNISRRQFNNGIIGAAGSLLLGCRFETGATGQVKDGSQAWGPEDPWSLGIWGYHEGVAIPILIDHRVADSDYSKMHNHCSYVLAYIALCLQARGHEPLTNKEAVFLMCGMKKACEAREEYIIKQCPGKYDVVEAVMEESDVEFFEIVNPVQLRGPEDYELCMVQLKTAAGFISLYQLRGFGEVQPEGLAICLQAYWTPLETLKAYDCDKFEIFLDGKRTWHENELRVGGGVDYGELMEDDGVKTTVTFAYSESEKL